MQASENSPMPSRRCSSPMRRRVVHGEQMGRWTPDRGKGFFSFHFPSHTCLFLSYSLLSLQVKSAVRASIRL